MLLCFFDLIKTFLTLIGPVIAGFANQFGIRPVIMVGSTIGATMWMVSAFAPNIYFVMGMFGFIGGTWNFS